MDEIRKFNEIRSRLESSVKSQIKGMSNILDGYPESIINLIQERDDTYIAGINQTLEEFAKAYGIKYKPIESKLKP